MIDIPDHKDLLRDGGDLQHQHQRQREDLDQTWDIYRYKLTVQGVASN